MSDIWNETCVIIAESGEVIKSKPMLGGHNKAISDCAKEIGLDIDPMQSMVIMLEKIVSKQNIVLLNGGKRVDENGNVKRGGYLALPNSFVVTQLEMVECLKEILNQYQGITTWKMEEGRLKTKSMGDVNYSITILNEMINQISTDKEMSKK